MSAFSDLGNWQNNFVIGTLRGAWNTEKPSSLEIDLRRTRAAGGVASTGGRGSAGGGSFLPLERELLLCFWASFFPLEIDDLLVALEVPEEPLGVPLQRLGVEDFVMVDDEKREKIESYRGTSTEVYVNACCWRKLRKRLNFEIFVVLEPTEISYDVRRCLR
jgi:hypothetical protein